MIDTVLAMLFEEYFLDQWLRMEYLLELAEYLGPCLPASIEHQTHSVKLVWVKFLDSEAAQQHHAIANCVPVVA